MEVTCAIHAHFQFAYEHCRRQYRRRMRIGLYPCWWWGRRPVTALLLRALLGALGERPMLAAIGEGLLILGWVAMWRPVEILLFERFENHQNRALLQRLAQIPVTFKFDMSRNRGNPNQASGRPHHGTKCRVALQSTRPAHKTHGDAATSVEDMHLFTEGDELYAAMLASIRSARDSVRMESYIFAADEIGWQFTQALVGARCSRCRCEGAP